MPKSNPMIPNEVVLTRLHDIAPEVQLIPAQAAMLLGIGLDQLKKDREEGNPPPSVKQGGAYRYRIGDVRDYLKSQKVFKNSNEAITEKMRRLESYSGFMSNAQLDDQWPFAIVGGKPIDFFESLGVDLDENEDHCQWLTLLEYLEKRKAYGLIEIAKEERNQLLDVINNKDLPELKISRIQNE